MITREELQGKWAQLKGQIRDKWGQISDDELQRVQGNTEKLLGMIQEKTGVARSEVEAFFDKAVQQGQNTLDQAGEVARKYASQAGEVVREQYDRATEQLEAGYESAQEMVRSRPAESLGVAFVAGVVAGGLIGLMLRPSRG